MKLLTYGSSTPKLIKSDNAGKGFLSAIQYLSPYKMSGQNVCPCASKGCAAACLNTAGRGRTNVVQNARLNRTRLFLDKRKEYVEQLYEEISEFNTYCKNKGQTAAIRLNGTSDLDWSKLTPNLFTDFSSIQFYDYTKVEKKMLRFLDGEFPSNYHLTFSRSETNDDKCQNVLDNGGNVVVVFSQKEFPKKWNGHKVYSAEEHDLRFIDPKNQVGALYAKGKARHDRSGFVISV
jgi:hypothetical protein